MSGWPVGTRIAAIRNATEDTVFLFGRGVYAGDHPRPGSGNWSPDTVAMARRVVEESLAEDVDAMRAADDAFMVGRLDEAVAAGKQTREEADQNLADYRRLRLEREAERAAMSVDEQVTELLTGMDLNPRLDLDGGGTVWGFECWWMPEAKFDKQYRQHRVVMVPEPVRSVA
ncbi:hypothetical protein E6R18_32920 [Streptomyces sp. A1277]|uniref:hypothetical protein n=1 Tax=Streptomyces sp. A1277 TaxID=2563103 RepID=UPI0010A228E2|nr:hypothetical protein [Streptomyces sp. A1277]THA22751.1 hypothetical protein E6R18_32920 [Streptomyces sp. A1277]